jgi:hypothetical protein
MWSCGQHHAWLMNDDEVKGFHLEGTCPTAGEQGTDSVASCTKQRIVLSLSHLSYQQLSIQLNTPSFRGKKS